MDGRTSLQSSGTVLGVVLILMSVTAMAFADALIKFVSRDVSVWQVFAVRAASAILFLYLLMKVLGQKFIIRSWVWVLARSVLLVTTWLLYYSSLPFLDLAVAAVAVYTSPIIITVLAVFITGAHIAPRQWLGIFTGFLGVFAVLNPGAEDFNWAVILPLMAALCYSASILVTSAKCRDEDSLLLAITLNGVFLAAGLMGIILFTALGLSEDTTSSAPFVLLGWKNSGWFEILVIMGLGCLSGLYFMGVAKAYQIAPPQIVATFDYGYLISAVFWGFIFFHETPGGITWVGIGLITAAGFLVFDKK